MKLTAVIFLCILLYVIKILWEKDVTDRTHPFGGDNFKLKKYLKNIGIKEEKKTLPKGEDYGVQTYWGKPDQKDSIKNCLDKIEWLGTNYTQEILWRRCAIYSILSGILAYLIIDYENFKITKAISVIFLLFIAFYMTKSYENTHIFKIKSKFITRNISIVKKKLKLSHENFILVNPLI